MEKRVYDLNEFIELMERNFLHDEEIKIELGSALYMLALEIRDIKNKIVNH